MDRENRFSRLLKLFVNMLYISAFTFGGGFVIAGLMKKKFVDQYKWISEDEMLDYIAIAQSCPGAIAVNTAILVGWHIAGFPGMLAAVIGTILPPLVILSVVSVFYTVLIGNRIFALVLRGMQAGIAAVLMDVVFDLGGKVFRGKEWFPIVLMIAAFCAVRFAKLGVVPVILIALGIGILRAVINVVSERRKRV